MPEKVPVLIMIQGQEPGARWKLEQTRVTTLGRSKRNQIKLSNPSVSRFHCEISYINGLWYVADLNSKKGTYLNGREVTEREVIKPGDVIRLSKNVFKFDMVAEEQEKDLRSMRKAAGPKESRYAQMQKNGAMEKEAEGAKATAKKEGGSWVGVIDFLFLVILAIVLGGLGYGSLAWAENRASRLRKEQIKRRRQRRKKLDRTIADVRAMINEESPRFESGYAQLQDLINKHPTAPQAEEAIRLRKRLEVAQFERGMEKMQKNLVARDYRTAFRQATRLAQELSSPDLVNIIQQQGRYIFQVSRTSMKQLLSNARMIIRNGGVEKALNHFKPRYKQLAANQKLLNRGKQMVEKLERLTKRQKEWEESGGDEGSAVTNEEIRQRFKPPEKMNW